jgi:hypothetical protein
MPESGTISMVKNIFFATLLACDFSTLVYLLGLLNKKGVDKVFQTELSSPQI